MDLNKIKKVHFVGIGGIGVSAVAKMMIRLGKKVSGSDLIKSEITGDLEKMGAKIFIGHQKENLDKDIDLLIYSPAVPENNPERRVAKEQKIQELSYPEFLGELSKDYFTIAISGTNGKTTTTAILGLILEKAGLDPTVIVGSKIKNFPDGNFRFGKGKYLVVEGCEWNAHMLKLHPEIIVLTNLEADHLDYYKDLDDIIFHFQKYIDKMVGKGQIVLNNDDDNLLKKLLPHRKVISYGIKKPADLVAKNIKIGNGFQQFDLVADSKLYNLNFTIDGLKMKIPGIFNIYNALAAATCAFSLGVKSEIVKEVLENYTGAWRRFELINADLRRLDADLRRPDADQRRYISADQFTPLSGASQCKSAIVVSDYAHHPTAIQGTIKAAKDFFPDKRIFVVFQPHHHNRTKTLFNDFVKSFDQADRVIVSEIYGVPGRELKIDEKVNSKDLVQAIEKRINKKVIYAKDLTEIKKLILENIQENDVLLVMGAGDIYKIAEELKSNG